MVGNQLIFQSWKNQIDDIEIMTYAYVSSGTFGSRVKTKSIDHRTHIQSEEVIAVKNQHLLVNQFTNLIWIIHTQEVTLVGYHKQLLKK